MEECESLSILRGLGHTNIWKNTVFGARLVLISMILEILRTILLKNYLPAVHVEILALELLLTMSGGYMMFRGALAIYHLEYVNSKLTKDMSLFSTYLMCNEIKFNIRTLVKSILTVSLTIALGLGFMLLLRTYNKLTNAIPVTRCWLSFTLSCPKEKPVEAWKEAVNYVVGRVESLFWPASDSMETG
ncbi:MAG: hypothetical protein F7C32_02470 [Desulfurococcales archaeon]|nr:hypothetical protein [Desulfurococcales archaeon]